MSNQEYTLALSGNPNVGKSTVFNVLTGLHQHTGNWCGKTVNFAQGSFIYNDNKYNVIDLPGTYSLISASGEEKIARDYICFKQYDAVLIIADAVCLERNLALVLQITERTSKAILCVNLIDEAKKKKIYINTGKLSKLLNIPVIPTSAKKRIGLDDLMKETELLLQKMHSESRSVIKYDERLVHATSNLKKFIATKNPSEAFAQWAALHIPESDEILNNEIFKYLKLTSHEIAEINNMVNQINLELSYLQSSNLTYKESIMKSVSDTASEIYKECVSLNDENYNSKDRRLDKFLTSKMTGYSTMLVLLCGIFWITIEGANHLSLMLSGFFDWLAVPIRNILINIEASPIVYGIAVDGIYKTLTWVISVMLPPMAIFFPLFTFLEDSGYLPRIAFNLDKYFRKACAHGKQSLTMCMGFGCNACGIIGCRIIDSPREKMIAMLTNTFVPCNGRFPGMIAIISMFMIGNAVGLFRSFKAAIILCAIIIFGIAITLIISKLLSKTVLGGLSSAFVLELPPYRRPQLFQVIVRSLLDRTIFVLGRAISVAAPAGAIIWIMANIEVGNTSILSHCTLFLDPFAQLIGLDGVILMAFILGWPANEIVVPLIIMTYMSTGTLADYSSLTELKQLFVANEWTLSTAVCTVLFSLLHFPCATTCKTIKKESGSVKWMWMAILIPTSTGIIVCFVVNNILKIFI